MKLSALLVSTLLLCFSHVSHARPAIVFSCGIPTSLPQWHSLKKLYSEAFDALGYDFSMEHVNTKRMLYEHKHSDRYDGICAYTRMPDAMLDEYKLIIVESPIGDPYTALWRNKNIPLTKTEKPALQANTKAGYLRGNGIAKRFIQQFENVTPVDLLRPDLGMKTLSAGRIDYWVGYAYTADFLAKDLALSDTVEKVAIIRQDFFYPLLKPELRSLKAPLEKHLRQAMTKRGELVR